MGGTILLRMTRLLVCECVRVRMRACVRACARAHANRGGACMRIGRQIARTQRDSEICTYQHRGVPNTRKHTQVWDSLIVAGISASLIGVLFYTCLHTCMSVSVSVCVHLCGWDVTG